MYHLLRDLSFVEVYLHNIFTFSKSEEDHVEHEKTVRERIAQYHRELKRFKWEVARPEVEPLGHIINIEDVKVIPAKI